MSETAIIRTSDCGTFKRCRRKWAFSSHLNHNRTQDTAASYLWIGTGCHYALEDYHGYNVYGHPVEAFRAFVHANKVVARGNSRVQLPPDIDEQITLGEGLLDYYLTWLTHRDPLETYYVDGVPQVEVKCRIKLPFTNEHYNEVYYQATLDRVTIQDGKLHIQDYKFYARDWTPNPEFDAQMSRYIWIGSSLYELPVVGALLQKHFKKLVKDPKILAGGKLSSDANQGTTYHAYKETLLEMYGSSEKFPLANRKCLATLSEQEGEHRDKFIQRSFTTRTPEAVRATGDSILMEVADMLNPNLPLYKNDTKDCAWDCSFSDLCLMMDDGDDWEQVLLDTTVDRSEGDESWRNHLPHLSQQA